MADDGPSRDRTATAPEAFRSKPDGGVAPPQEGAAQEVFGSKPVGGVAPPGEGAVPEIFRSKPIGGVAPPVEGANNTPLIIAGVSAFVILVVAGAALAFFRSGAGEVTTIGAVDDTEGRTTGTASPSGSVAPDIVRKTTASKTSKIAATHTSTPLISSTLSSGSPATHPSAPDPIQIWGQNPEGSHARAGDDEARDISSQAGEELTGEAGLSSTSSISSNRRRRLEAQDEANGESKASKQTLGPISPPLGRVTAERSTNDTPPGSSSAASVDGHSNGSTHEG